MVKLCKQSMGNLLQCYCHFVWSVKNRESLLAPNIRYPLLEHMRQYAQRQQIELVIINGVANHIHALVKLKSTQSMADMIKKMKGESSRWLNLHHFPENNFLWQAGYGSFTVSPDRVPTVVRYILNQERHHKK